MHCYAPDGSLLGKLHLPETAGNLEFGGMQRNRLYICGSTSMYACYVNTQGALTSLTVEGRRSRNRSGKAASAIVGASVDCIPGPGIGIRRGPRFVRREPRRRSTRGRGAKTRIAKVNQHPGLP